MPGAVASEKFKDRLGVPVRNVSPEYFDTIGVPVVAGRNFGPPENQTNRIGAIINQAMAARYFPNTEPVGQRFRMAFRNSVAGINRPFTDAEVIGVAGNSSDAALTEQAQPEFYVSFAQVATPFQSLIVRTGRDPRPLLSSIQHRVQSLDPTASVEHLKTLAQIRNDSIAPQLFTMRLLTVFSIVAGALALMGLYGVLSLSVASRSQEMAIRMAVGAPRRNVFALVLGEGLRLVAAGIAIGAILAAAFTGLLKGLLFGVEPADPLTLIVTAFLFTAAAVLACYFPARRATRIDPMEALRFE